MIYVFDSNTLSQLFQNYYPSRFPSLWEKFDLLIADGTIISVSEVYEEIHEHGERLSKWTKQNKSVFQKPSLKENNAKVFGWAVRNHWAIENKLHWSLDVMFREDDSRIRIGNASENMAILRHMALNILRQEKTSKRGVKTKRLQAGWDEGYLVKLLGLLKF